MIRKFGTIATLSLTVALGGAVHAQTKTNDKTRSRRVATQPKPEPTPEVVTPPADNSTPLTGSIGVKPEPAKTEEKPKTPEVPADDSLDTLRTQIEEATGPDKIKLQLQLADRLVASGNRTEAVAELNRVATSEILDPPGFYNLGNSFARLGETDGAVGAYRKAIEQRRGRYSKAYNNLGVVQMRAGRWDDARDSFLSALKLESFRYPEASYNLGRLYAARGEHDLAVREWRRALAVDPQHKAAAQAIAGIGSDRITVVAAPTPTSASSNNSVSTSSNRSTPGPVRASKSLTLDQASYDYMQRARTAAERGNLTDAVDNFRRVISRQGGYFGPANLELSYALLTLKKYDEALPNLLQVTSREGTRYPISYFHLARLYEMKGELPLAEAAFMNAAQAFGNSNSQFFLDLSRVREKQSNFKGALEAFEKYVAAMEQQGMKLPWLDERLAALRTKASQ